MRKAVILEDEEMVIARGVYEGLLEDAQMFYLATSMLTEEQLREIEETWREQYRA